MAKTGNAGKPGKAEKTFSLHWGSGVVAEEAQSASEWHRPTIQLLEFTDGEAKGRVQVRFCYYSHKGAFQRSPLVLSEEDLPALRSQIRQFPRLHRLLKQLV